MIPGMAYPATLLALATAGSYPPPRDLFGTKTQDIADLGAEHGQDPGTTRGHPPRKWPEAT